MDVELNKLLNTPAWTTEQEKIIEEPYLYICKQSGKELRTLLINTFNIFYQIPQTQLDKITRIIEVLHNSSLLIDDVEDNSELRRGEPVAHSIFGTAFTINSANYMYFKAIEYALDLNDGNANCNVMKVLNEEFLNLHRGQALDLYFRDTLKCPTEADYVDMVMNKTGGLFRLSIRLMELIQKNNVNDNLSDQQLTISFVPLVNLLGIIYQIKDDYLNLKHNQYFANKGYCEDLQEGKFSFPVIHAIRFDTGNQEVINILKQKTDNKKLKTHVVKYMNETSKSFEYCETTLNKLKLTAFELLKSLIDGNFPNFEDDPRINKGYNSLKMVIDKICSI